MLNHKKINLYSPLAPKLSSETVRVIIADVLAGESLTKTAKKHGTSQGHVSAIMYAKVWKHLAHSQDVVQKWRHWLEHPTLLTYSRQKTDRSHILRHFDKTIKIL